VAFYNEHKIAIVVHKMQTADVPKEFHLDSFVETKLRKMDEDKKIQLFMPIWQNNLSFKCKAS
jgi:hypothetical protein